MDGWGLGRMGSEWQWPCRVGGSGKKGDGISEGMRTRMVDECRQDRDETELSALVVAKRAEREYVRREGIACLGLSRMPVRNVVRIGCFHEVVRDQDRG
jgi:hypothetical protein